MSQKKDPNNETSTQLEQSILLEIIELDDRSLDAVTGGDGYHKNPVFESSNGSGCINGSSC
jgi:hypothetical protein